MRVAKKIVNMIHMILGYALTINILYLNKIYSYKDPIDIYSTDESNSSKNEDCDCGDKYGLERSLIIRLIGSAVKLKAHSNSVNKLAMKIIIDADSLHLLEEYLNDQNERSGLLRLVEIFESISLLDEVHTHGKIYHVCWRLKNYLFLLLEKFFLAKKTKMIIHMSYAFIIIAGFIPVVTFFRMRSPITFLILLLVSQSVLVEWTRLYQKTIAFKMSKYGKGAPRACANLEDLSYLESIFLWVSNTFTLKTDECHEYYSNILVDPMTEISILEALSSALRRFLGNYILDFTVVINNSIISLLSNLPIQWQIIVFCSALILLIIFVLVYVGIEINSPLFGINFKGKTRESHMESNPEKELRMIQVIKETVKDEISKNMDDTRDEICKMITNELNKTESNDIFNSTKIE
ncbi:hypothetical protein HZS_4898 [Henneguya salminicola]|nr:hypothetical protein HZS_4898 [Henneguya salminicola]